MKRVPYKHLDPGIREIVRRLNRARFVTTDSGDGVSKPPAGRVLPFPHVAIASTRLRMIEDAGRVQAFLAGADLLKGVKVEATYDPADESVVIMVMWP